MSEPRHEILDKVDTAIGDCRDLFHVLGLVLSASIGPLDGVTRGALVTVARLGAARGAEASAGVERAMEVRRG